jgi:hypothetical protein
MGRFVISIGNFQFMARAAGNEEVMTANQVETSSAKLRSLNGELTAANAQLRAKVDALESNSSASAARAQFHRHHPRYGGRVVIVVTPKG